MTLLECSSADGHVPVQEAIGDAAKAGLRSIDFGVEPSAGDLTTEPRGVAADLAAQRVSDVWLSQYISPDQWKATGCLSLFAATFNSDGAAAVVHGPDASPQQRSDTARMLHDLRGVSVVQEVNVQHAAHAEPMHQRYSMHPLVRGLAAEMQAKNPDHGHDRAIVGFVQYMLCRPGAELANLSQTAANAPTATQLLLWRRQTWRLCCKSLLLQGSPVHERCSKKTRSWGL